MKTRNGILLLIVLAVCGCTTRNQLQVEQTLLLQENQRLENALYVTHAQLVQLRRENESLRGQGTSQRTSTSSIPLLRPKRAEFAPRDDYDEAPSFEPPKVDVPSGEPGSGVLPDALKSSRAFPKLNPPKKVQTDFPELTLPGADESTLPAWSPTR